MALTLNGYPITDFSGRDPGLPSVIKNGNPERIALYPLAHDDGGAGTLRDQVTLTNATTAGGSTLLAAAKRRNDYQRLTSTFPSLGYRASGAVVNKYAALAAGIQNTSAEVDLTAGDHTVTNATISVIDTDAWHGSHCFCVLATGAAPAMNLNITAAVGNVAHNDSRMVKAPTGRTIRVNLTGDVSGATNADFTATGNWQQVAVLKTFAADTVRTASVSLTDGVAGDVMLVDAIMGAGSAGLMFTEQEATATSCTFPTPFTAGEPVSFLFFVWTPWAGNDGVLHRLFDAYTAAGGGGGIRFSKDAANNINFSVYNGANLKNCAEPVDATDWPAGGFKRIAISRNAAGVMSAYLNGTVFTTLNNGPGTGLETVQSATTAIGSDIGGANPLNGLILPYIYRGVAWGDEECQYYSSLQAPPPRNRMVF